MRKYIRADLNSLIASIRAILDVKCLEDKLQRELHDTRIADRQTAGSADVALDLAENSGAVQGCYRGTRV